MRSVCSCAIVASFFPPHTAFPRETIYAVVGQEAPELERLAASELSAQWGRLFDVDVQIVPAPPSSGEPTVLIGSPSTNPTIRQRVGDSWPRLSDQGIAARSLKTGGPPTLVVGGGSPVATLWAVYELGHQLGVRYLLREDVYPAVAKPGGVRALLSSDVDWVREPVLRTRAWRTINDFPIGPESWPLADHEKLLRQLAKLKFNRIVISIYPWQPFVDYEFGGVKKSTAVLWSGEEFPLTIDMPGRTAFGSAKRFENPDFAGAQTAAERTTKGIALLRGIIREAHRLGMTAGLSISPLEFPREFAAALPGGTAPQNAQSLLVGPAAHTPYNDPRLRELARTTIRAYLATYPELDALYLTPGVFSEWGAQVEPAWKALAARLAAPPPWEELASGARERSLLVTGDRGEKAVRSHIVALACLNELLADGTLLRRDDGKPVECHVAFTDPQLYPHLQGLLPRGTGALHFIAPTARRVAEQEAYLSQVPAERISSSLFMTLADDNVGVLSQSTTHRLEQLMDVVQRKKWDGFCTRYWMLAELDPSVHYLARSAWDSALTARADHDDLFVAISGKQAVADRMWLALEHIEAATELIDQRELGFAYPDRDMFLKHYRAEPAPAWWGELNERYTQAMTELYRSHGTTDPRSKTLLFYWAKRSEYVLEYLASLTAMREAAQAFAENNPEAGMEKMETAQEQLFNAIDTLGDVALDQGDRGLIAVLNAYAYRPLAEKYEELTAAER